MNAALGFDLFAPGALPLLVLFGSRVTGLMLIAPLYSARPIPVMMRAGVLVTLVVLMLPVVSRGTSTPPAVTAPALLSEAMVGFTIGLGAALIVGAAETAGELLAIQIGLQGSAIVDPLQMHQTTALGQFMQLFAIALLLSLNAHVVMLDALRSSVELIPVGTVGHLQDGFGRIVSLGGWLFVAGLRFAAPVVAVVLMVNVAMAVLSRAAPQLNILALAFPVQILAGIAALIALMPILASWFLGWETSYADLIGRGLEPFVPGRR
ncbi:MAG: flagellar biosynthetic protein FliR [Gemmatimonadaceae bacterium]